MKSAFLITLASVLLAGSGMAAAQSAPAANGTLTVDFKEFTSEVKLKPKVEKILKTGGIEWGAKDGQVVFTMVSKRFINFDMPQFTRYGMQASVPLPAGEYALTGVGFMPVTAFSTEKMLEKGGYFNDNVMRFKVEPGKVTTLSIRPVIQKTNTFFLKFFQPALLTTAITDQGKSEEVSIVAKTDKSILWPNYNGPLKFAVKK
jgi:hypothetical protein